MLCMSWNKTVDYVCDTSDHCASNTNTIDLHVLPFRAASHYSWKSRGCRCSPIILQETQSSASRPCHIGGQSPMAVALQNVHMAVLLDQGYGSQRNFGPDMIRNPNYG